MHDSTWGRLRLNLAPIFLPGYASGWLLNESPGRTRLRSQECGKARNAERLLTIPTLALSDQQVAWEPSGHQLYSVEPAYYGNFDAAHRRAHLNCWCMQGRQHGNGPPRNASVTLRQLTSPHSNQSKPHPIIPPLAPHQNHPTGTLGRWDSDGMASCPADVCWLWVPPGGVNGQPLKVTSLQSHCRCRRLADISQCQPEMRLFRGGHIVRRDHVGRHCHSTYDGAY